MQQSVVSTVSLSISPIHKLKIFVVLRFSFGCAWEEVCVYYPMTLLTGNNNSLIYAVANTHSLTAILYNNSSGCNHAIIELFDSECRSVTFVLWNVRFHNCIYGYEKASKLCKNRMVLRTRWFGILTGESIESSGESKKKTQSLN